MTDGVQVAMIWALGVPAAWAAGLTFVHLFRQWARTKTVVHREPMSGWVALLGVVWPVTVMMGVMMGLVWLVLEAGSVMAGLFERVLGEDL